jgi:hypothetical protein
MLDVTQSVDTDPTKIKSSMQDKKRADMPVWETPALEDVSEQVMAQPYIRFT